MKNDLGKNGSTGQEANVQSQKISMYMLPLQNGLEFPSDGGVSRDQNDIQRNV